eukprot:s670_g3.t1
MAGRALVTEVCVLGGGVLGTAIARAAAGRGIATMLLEKSFVGSGVSAGNTGIACTMLGIQKGTEEWQCLAQGRPMNLPTYQSLGIPHSATGAHYVAWSDSEMGALGTLQGEEASSQMLSVEDLRALEPHLGGEAQGALFVPEEVTVDPNLVVLAYAAEAYRHGAHILEQTQDAHSFLQLIAAFALETAEDVRAEGFNGDPELLVHCLDSFRYAALVSSLVEEFSAFNAARRYKWLRLALFRAGLAVPRIHPAIHSTLRELTSLVCLEFGSAPSDEQLNLFQQSGLLGLIGGVGSPETPLLRRLSERNGLGHAGTLLDSEYSSRCLTARAHGFLHPWVLMQLMGLYRSQKSISLGRLLRFLGWQGESEDSTEGARARHREFGWERFPAAGGRSYTQLAEAPSGLFRRSDDYEVFDFSAVPVMLAAERPAGAEGAYKGCAGASTNALTLILNQGFENATLVEPLLHHVVEDALYMHSGQWADLTADSSEEEAVREAPMGEVCQLSGRDETFRFADVFDVAHFRKELRSLGVERTVSFDDFLEQGGSIDTLFLLNTAFQPGGAWIRHIFAEPLLHCRDDEHFNGFVKAFDGRDVFVKRVICLAADASTLDHR